MARNYFASPFETGQDAFDRGFDRQQAITDRITTTQAGRKLASGDRAGAAKTFAAGGLIQPARQMQADQQAEDDRAYERGNAEQDRMTKMKAQQAQALIRIAQGLREVPAGQRQAALQQALPILGQIGVDPSMFAALTEDQLSDDQLNLFAGEMEKQWQALNLGNGGLGRFNSRTGATEVIREPDPPPVIVGNGAIAVDRGSGDVLARNPKTFAPPRASGGRGGAKSAGGIPALPPGFVMEK